MTELSVIVVASTSETTVRPRSPCSIVSSAVMILVMLAGGRRSCAPRSYSTRPVSPSMTTAASRVIGGAARRAARSPSAPERRAHRRRRPAGAGGDAEAPARRRVARRGSAKAARMRARSATSVERSIGTAGSDCCVRILGKRSSAALGPAASLLGYWYSTMSGWGVSRIDVLPRSRPARRAEGRR